MAAAVELRIASVASCDEGGDWLTAAERARAAAIASQRRRRQFIAGRWIARTLLAESLGGAPRDWPLSADAGAPPRPLVPGPAPLHIALSHSADFVLCAIAPTPLGVDVETPRRPPRDVDALGTLVFGARERSRARTLAPAARERHFHDVWTLKEAWLKRRGEAVSPHRLVQLHTERCEPHAAVARVWRHGGATLAVAADADLPWHWRGDTAPAGPGVPWRITSP